MVCSNRRRQRSQPFSAKEFVEAVSDNEADLDSDDDIVGEAVYDEEYLSWRNQRRKMSSSSEGDEECRGDEENAEDNEEEEEDDDGDDSSSVSGDGDGPQRSKKMPGRTRRETKLRSVDELQSGLRRSKRATQNRINYNKLISMKYQSRKGSQQDLRRQMRPMNAQILIMQNFRQVVKIMRAIMITR